MDKTLKELNSPGRSFYDQSNNLEYYHIPKNGMTSIRLHFNLGWVDSINPLPLDRRVFCVFRNPVDRLISSYVYLKRYGGRDVGCRPIRIEQTSLNAIFGPPAIGEKVNTLSESFSKYVSEIELNSFFDNHHLPQSYYVDNDLMPGKRPIGVRKPEFITHYIDFNDMDAGLSLVFGRDIKLPKSNSTSASLASEIKNGLTKQTIETINKIYSDDVILYNNTIK